MAKIFVARALPGNAIERLREAGHAVTVHGGSMPPTREELLAGVADADGLLSLLTDRVDGELLDSAPQLKAVANFAVGCDNIDLAAAAERGIPVGVAAHVLTDATADLTMALLLAAARNLPEGERDAREGRWKTWEPEGWLGRELRGAKLLIVGRGRIGQAVADRAEPFGTQISFAGRGDDLHAALAEADIVSIHCPLNEQTRHLIDADALAAMKPDALLINTTRGGVVDQAALIEALHAGTIGSAALDVTDPEPPPADDPIYSAPNCLIVPHIGSATATTRAAMGNCAADNLLAALAGEPMPTPAPAPPSA